MENALKSAMLSATLYGHFNGQWHLSNPFTCHFSFSNETGNTFISNQTQTRIKKNALTIITLRMDVFVTQNLSACRDKP